MSRVLVEPNQFSSHTRAIRSAQTQVEQQNFEIRKNVLKYDEVLNKQRTVIYDERRLVLAGENIKEQIENMLTDVVTAHAENSDWPTKYRLSKTFARMAESATS